MSGPGCNAGHEIQACDQSDAEDQTAAEGKGQKKDRQDQEPVAHIDPTISVEVINLAGSLNLVRLRQDAVQVGAVCSHAGIGTATGAGDRAQTFGVKRGRHFSARAVGNGLTARSLQCCTLFGADAENRDGVAGFACSGGGLFRCRPIAGIVGEQHDFAARSVRALQDGLCLGDGKIGPVAQNRHQIGGKFGNHLRNHLLVARQGSGDKGTSE